MKCWGDGGTAPQNPLQQASKILLTRRCGQLRDQTKRYRQLIKLEVRPEECYGFVDAGLSRHFAHVDTSLPERMLRLDARRSSIIGRYVKRNPLIQPALAVPA